MYLAHTIYPLALASVNVAVGWLLYRLLESAIGIPIIVVGLLVILTLLGGMSTSVFTANERSE